MYKVSDRGKGNQNRLSHILHFAPDRKEKEKTYTKVFSYTSQNFLRYALHCFLHAMIMIAKQI